MWVYEIRRPPRRSEKPLTQKRTKKEGMEQRHDTHFPILVTFFFRHIDPSTFPILSRCGGSNHVRGGSLAAMSYLGHLGVFQQSLMRETLEEKEQ